MFSGFGESSSSLPLSYYHSSSLTTQESNNTFSQQNNQQNLFQGSYIYMPPSTNNPIYDNLGDNNFVPLHSTSKLMLGDPIGGEQALLNCNFDMIINSITSKKASSKKDRHTKICTAQGIRDRRVRMSINIAREFFNLQDMLGFDKASKTIGWLLEKSKDAIDELENKIKYNRGTSKCSSLTDENTIEEEDENQISNGNKIDVREIRRAKARERARERTKSKKMMAINNLSSPHEQHQEISQHNVMLCRSSSSSYGHNTTISVGESIIKNKKLKGSFHEMDFKNSQEVCSYNKDHLTKFPLENELGCSHSNMANASKGFQILAKQWDTRSNQMLN